MVASFCIDENWPGLWCMSARKGNSVIAFRVKVLTIKGNYNLAKTLSPFHLAIEFVNNCAWKIESLRLSSEANLPVTPVTLSKA